MAGIVYITALKNVAYTLYTPVFDAEWSDTYITSAAGLDSEKSQDGGSFADCTNELTEIDATGVYGLTITQAEMNYDTIIIKAITSTTAAKIPLFVIKTYENQLDIANTELAAAPTTTSSLRIMQQFVFQYFRNKRTETAAVETMFKEDASTPLSTSALSDDGTTFTRGEMS